MCSLTRLALVGAVILLTTRACGRARFAARDAGKGDSALTAA
jgi:hypothetical protein